MLLLGLLLLAVTSRESAAAAGSLLSNVFGNDMVLQRAPSVAILFGVSNTSGATVTTKFAGKTYSTTTDAKKVWRQKLPPQPASLVGANISVVSSVGESAQITGVLFGDVFMCGGQSSAYPAFSSWMP